MGISGLAAFENDAASDFAYAVAGGGWSVAANAMTTLILTLGHHETPESQRGISAAALVATKRRPGVVELPQETLARVGKPPSPPLVANLLANLAIGRGLKRSELQGLGAEGDELENWRAETRKAQRAR